MTDERDAARGHSARREYAETEAAFAAVERAILQTLANTPVGQDTKVLSLHMALQNLAAVKQAIMAVIQNGMIAEQAISQAGLTRPL